MQLHRDGPAVGVFIKRAEPGEVKTRLGAAIGAEAAALLYRAFVADLVETIEQLSEARKVVFFTPPSALRACRTLCRRSSGRLPGGIEFRPQASGALGRRLRTAFAELFGAGASEAILVGSDCPTLHVGVLTDAIGALRRCDLVLGPSEDGGYYLIGMRQPQPDLFRRVPWSTDRVLEITLRRARSRRLRTVVLPHLRDVDDVADLDCLGRDLLTLWTDAVSAGRGRGGRSADRRGRFPLCTFRCLFWELPFRAIGPIAGRRMPGCDPALSLAKRLDSK
jgi:hypothetical protein